MAQSTTIDSKKEVSYLVSLTIIGILFFIFGFVVLLGVSGGAVYYIRQGKNISKVGDDFKILDE